MLYRHDDRSVSQLSLLYWLTSVCLCVSVCLSVCLVVRSSMIIILTLSRLAGRRVCLKPKLRFDLLWIRRTTSRTQAAYSRSISLFHQIEGLQQIHNIWMSWHSRMHWRCQLWGTGARAPPGLPASYFGDHSLYRLLTSHAHGFLSSRAFSGHRFCRLSLDCGSALQPLQMGEGSGVLHHRQKF